MDVRISYATLQGHVEPTSGVHSFLGIPYAEPPLGALRWRPPQTIRRDRGVLDATRYGPIPSQPHQPHQRGISRTLFFTPAGPQSEDCLTLNVWTPTLDRTARLPVMVWIPGGGFRGGSAASPLYECAALAARGVVVVSINYRVSRFGFLSHRWLTKESPHGSSGNYGLLDQVAALQWVRDEIASFGGDAGCVTIFGQSAGSQSVVFLMSSPLAAGLFHRAIAQSGSPFSSAARPGLIGRQTLTLAEADAEGEMVAARMAAASLEDLRNRTADEVLRACPPDSFTSSRPIIDGWVVPQRPDDAFAAGAFNDVPLLCGTVADEGTIFDCQWAADEHRAFRDRHLHDAADDYSTLYQDGDTDHSRSGATASYRDRMYAWPMHALARSLAMRSAHACYLYRFEIAPPCPSAEQADCSVPLGAYHGAELPFIFGSFYPRAWDWTASHQAISDRLQSIWTRFAKEGRIDGWPIFKEPDGQLMALSDSAFAPRRATTARSQFWDTLANRAIRSGT